MSDTFITVIAIGLAAVLMFVFPLMTIADRTDDVAQLSVETATTDFVDKIRSTGKITQDEMDKYMETITSTGNTYKCEMEVKVKDSNLGKKTTQAVADRTGDNAYYSVFDSQIEAELEKNGVYYCKEGDIVSAKVINTNQTVAQQFKNFFYTVTGNDAYTIAAEHAGVVTVNGK